MDLFESRALSILYRSEVAPNKKINTKAKIHLLLLLLPSLCFDSVLLCCCVERYGAPSQILWVELLYHSENSLSVYSFRVEWTNIQITFFASFIKDESFRDKWVFIPKNDAHPPKYERHDKSLKTKNHHQSWKLYRFSVARFCITHHYDERKFSVNLLDFFFARRIKIVALVVTFHQKKMVQIKYYCPLYHNCDKLSLHII